MKYRFNYKVKAIDILKLTLYNIYSSLVGICNIVFTCAMIFCLLSFWKEVNIFLKIVMLFLCILFPVLQPILIYMRSKKQLKAIPKGMILEFNDTGIDISSNNNIKSVSWNKVKKVSSILGMVILVFDNGQGFILNKEVLGNLQKDLAAYIESKVKK